MSIGAPTRRLATVGFVSVGRCERLCRGSNASESGPSADAEASDHVNSSFTAKPLWQWVVIRIPRSGSVFGVFGA